MAAAAGRRASAAASPPATAAGVVRTRPVRVTVDLAPPLHRRLKRWADFAAGELDAPSVAAADVVRALLARLTMVRSDPDYDPRVTELLSEVVLSDLRDLRD